MFYTYGKNYLASNCVLHFAIYIFLTITRINMSSPDVRITKMKENKINDFGY